MFTYQKTLQYPVKIATPNPRLASVIISQYGGPDGELGASMRYLSQRYAMPYPEISGLLTDIGTEGSGWHSLFPGGFRCPRCLQLKPPEPRHPFQPHLQPSAGECGDPVQQAAIEPIGGGGALQDGLHPGPDLPLPQLRGRRPLVPAFCLPEVLFQFGQLAVVLPVHQRQVGCR